MDIILMFLSLLGSIKFWKGSHKIFFMLLIRLSGKRPFKLEHFTDPIWRQVQCSSIKDGISYFSNWIDICSQFVPPCSLKATKSFQSLAFVLVSYSFLSSVLLFSKNFEPCFLSSVHLLLNSPNLSIDVA